MQPWWRGHGRGYGGVWPATRVFPEGRGCTETPHRVEDAVLFRELCPQDRRQPWVTSEWASWTAPRGGLSGRSLGEEEPVRDAEQEEGETFAGTAFEAEP